MYIGKAAQLSGTTVKSIRHYEHIGLLPAPQRRGAYRVYSEQSVELLMLSSARSSWASSSRKCRPFLISTVVKRCHGRS